MTKCDLEVRYSYQGGDPKSLSVSEVPEDAYEDKDLLDKFVLQKVVENEGLKQDDVEQTMTDIPWGASPQTMLQIEELASRCGIFSVSYTVRGNTFFLGTPGPSLKELDEQS